MDTELIPQQTPETSPRGKNRTKSLQKSASQKSISSKSNNKQSSDTEEIADRNSEQTPSQFSREIQIPLLFLKDSEMAVSSSNGQEMSLDSSTEWCGPDRSLSSLVPDVFAPAKPGKFWGEFEDSDKSIDDEKQEPTASNFPTLLADKNELREASSSKQLGEASNPEVKFFSAYRKAHKPENSHLIDPLVLHSIALLQYKRILAQNNISKNLPKFPEMCSRPFFGETTSRLSDREAYFYSRKSMAALSAHVGFQDSEAEALEVLVDVFSECMEKMCHVLKNVHERRCLTLESAYGSTLSQMLNLLGITRVSELREFYVKRVIKPHERLLTECSELSSKVGSNKEADNVNENCDMVVDAPE